jgi:hypothetical protein
VIALDLVELLALMGMLLVIGWGYGLAAALAWCSVRPVRALRPVRAAIAGLLLALLVASSVSYAYARVLDAIELIDYCDPVAASAAVC